MQKQVSIGNKVQGFLQGNLIAEISLSDLQKYQHKEQAERPGAAKKIQDQNPLSKVKVSFNRPRFSQNCGAIRDELLEFQLLDLPSIDTQIEDKVIADLKELQNDFKFILEFQQNLALGNEESEIKKQGIQNEQKRDKQDNKSINNLFNQIKLVDKPNQNYFPSSNQSDKENQQKREAVIRLQRETGLAVNDCHLYIEQYESYDKAIEAYYDQIQKMV